MATLTEQLKGIEDRVRTNVPEPISSAIFKAIDNHKASFVYDKVIKPGATLPSFALNNANGKQVTLTELLDGTTKGLLITFYRGEWCPYCNLAVAHLQKKQEEFEKRGVKLVAITPEVPGHAAAMTEKHDLTFEVLSDLHNNVARQLGIVWKQFEELKPVTEMLKVDFHQRNGDPSRELPVPSTFLIDKGGVVRNVHVDPDWSKRLEPDEALQWADQLESQGYEYQ